MKKQVTFVEQEMKLVANFGQTHRVSDGGFERGYEQGVADGYKQGLSARTYETWTITLVDGTVVEKEVALL